MRKNSIRVIYYALAIMVLVLGAVPGFRLWQQVRSGRWGYDDEEYFDYNRLLAVGILFVGVIVAVALLWIVLRHRKR